MSAPHDPVGSVAEEAARLVEALGIHFPGPGAGADSGEPGHHHTPVGDAIACSLCPVCQGIGFVSALSPEAVHRLADLATTVAETLRRLAAAVGNDAGHPADHDAGHPAHQPPDPAPTPAPEETTT